MTVTRVDAAAPVELEFDAVPFVPVGGAPEGADPLGKVPFPPGPPDPPPPIPESAFATPPDEVRVAAPVRVCWEVRSMPKEIQAKIPSVTSSERREYSTKGSWPLAVSSARMLSPELRVRS